MYTDSKSNLHHTRSITPKQVTSGGVHLHSLARGQHSFKETPHRWRAVGDTLSVLTDPVIKPQTSSTDRIILATGQTGRL